MPAADTSTPRITRERVEKLMRDAGHAINANDGRCPLVEKVLCDVTGLCCDLLKREDSHAALVAALKDCHRMLTQATIGIVAGMNFDNVVENAEAALILAARMK